MAQHSNGKRRLRLKPPKGDTIRWHGVIGYDYNEEGMTIAELRAFLQEADAEAYACGMIIEDCIPLVSGYRNGALKNIWVAICRRKEAPEWPKPTSHKKEK